MSTIEQIIKIPGSQIVAHTIPTLITHFDFFNRIANQVLTFEELRTIFRFDERVLDTTLAYLRKERFIEKRNDQKYQLNPEIQNWMTTDGENNLSAFATILNGIVPSDTSNAIAFALQTGKPANYQAGKTWEELMRDGTLSKSFSEGMMCRGRLLAKYVASRLETELRSTKRLLDVGGSLADYCGALTQHYQNLDCTVLDLPEVIEHAKENIATRQYTRVNTTPADMLAEELPRGFDTHLYSNVMHDWTAKQVLELLQKSHRTLEKEGKVLIHDMHLNDDKISPEIAVNHSLYLSIYTRGRCYSKKEIQDLIHAAGFTKTTCIQTIGCYSVIVAIK